MSFQIRAIAIYSKAGGRREVRLKLGALNIITGASKTGKSALLDIVDYCWGRSECTIAEGEIRRSVSWFAVLFDRGGEGILVARKNPGPAARASDEIYFERNVEDFPETHDGFNKNVTGDGLRAHLAQLLGISENLYVPEEGATRKPLEASSGQAITFCLQAQDEIASRRFLFHRQGEPFLPQMIKDSLPYFVGAMEEDHFLKKKRHDDAIQRLKRLQRRYMDALALANETSGNARSLLTEGQRVGLIPQDLLASTPQDLRAALADATTPRLLDYAPYDDRGPDLVDLEERRRTLRAELQELREEIADLNRLMREASEFESEAQEQQARLASVGLLSDRDGIYDTCPLCASHLDTPVPSVSEIQRSLESVNHQLSSVKRDAPRVQARIALLEARRTELEAELRAVQQNVARRIAENERLRIAQDQFTEQARVVGRIGYYLENAAAIEAPDGLRQEIARVEAEIAELERAVDHEALEERLATALSLVGRDMTIFASELALEHGNNSLRLDRKNLTVVADTIDGPLPLRSIGSGENWVGYHVVAHLALHKLFRARQRPVPAFLMLDQPSQAHYPPDRDIGEISGDEDEDQVAVARLYRLLWEYCSTLSPSMQIIVSDHVELLEDWFRKLIVQRWRDGIKLVPVSWLQQ